MKLLEAFTGKDAVDLYKSQNPDCVLLDMYLSDIDGQTVARLIRKHEKLTGKKRIPIIGITADCTREHISKALDAGCDICLVRPVEKTELYNHISNFLIKTDKDEISFEKISDDIEDIRQMALERIKKIALEIINACRGNDLTEVKRLGHALTGLGMTFRLEHVEDTGKKVMESARKGNTGNIRILASAIID